MRDQKDWRAQKFANHKRREHYVDDEVADVINRRKLR
jgi:hypothetical protein